MLCPTDLKASRRAQSDYSPFCLLFHSLLPHTWRSNMGITRRGALLKGTALGTAALALAGPAASAADQRKVVIGVVGTGGMGSHHVRFLSSRKDVELAYVCDVDKTRLAAAAAIVEK